MSDYSLYETFDIEILDLSYTGISGGLYPEIGNLSTLSKYWLSSILNYVSCNSNGTIINWCIGSIDLVGSTFFESSLPTEIGLGKI